MDGAPAVDPATLLALAGVRTGEVVVVSGAAVLAYAAAAATGPAGRVLAIGPGESSRVAHLRWLGARSDRLPVADHTVDKVVYGVLGPDPAATLADAARVLLPGGRVAVAHHEPVGDAFRAAGLRPVHHEQGPNGAYYATATPLRA